MPLASASRPRSRRAHAMRGFSTPLFAGMGLVLLLGMGALGWWWAESSMDKAAAQGAQPAQAGATAKAANGVKVSGAAVSASANGRAPTVQATQPNAAQNSTTGHPARAQAQAPVGAEAAAPSLPAEASLTPAQVAGLATLLQAAAQSAKPPSEQQPGRVDLRRSRRMPTQGTAAAVERPVTTADTGLPALPQATLLPELSTRSPGNLGDTVAVTLSSSATLDEVRDFYTRQWTTGPGSTAQVSLLTNDGEQLDLRMADPTQRVVQRVLAVAVPGGVLVQLSRAGGR